MASGRPRLRLAALSAAFCCLLGALPAAAATGPGDDGQLEQAREEAGAHGRPPTRYSLPAGRLRVTPSELLAGRPGERIRFTVELERRVPDATLTVTLPRRWVIRPASGLRATRPATLRDRARGRARLRRAGRALALGLEDAPSGSSATFELVDVGIPAGTYRLPFAWREASGRRTRAGSARVVFYAHPREDPEEARFLRLANPGVAADVSGDGLEESETFIAVTPWNKDRIAVGSNWQSASMPAWVTDDGGVSWTGLTLPQTIDAPATGTNESGDVCCDPMFAADGLGNIWYGGLALKKGAAAYRIVVNRIAAGTESFRPVTTGLPARTDATQDKPMMTIDNAPSSPTYGRLYVVWDEFTPTGAVNLVISECDTRVGGVAQPARCDDADSWSAPVSVTPAGGSYIYPDVEVGPDGRVYVIWWDYSNVNAIRGDVCDPSAQSCASASGWGTPQTVAVLDATGAEPVPFACPIPAQPGGRASPSPQVEVDRSGGSQDGRVYVSWGDLRPGSGSTRCADDGVAPLATNMTFDAFVSSAPSGALPGGAAASESVGTRLLTDGEGGGEPNSDDWFPWLAVDQTTGQAWADLYSTRDDPARRTTNFYARSLTPSGGGHSLGPLTKVSGAPSDYSTSPCCDFGNDYGDYTGMAATQGVAYPVWTDNSGGDGEAFTYVEAAGPTAVTGPATDVGQTQATLTAAVNPRGSPTSYHFEYGTAPGAYGRSTAEQSAGASPSEQPVSQPVSGLTPGTAYYFRVVAENALGTATGGERTFTTVAPSPPPPSPPTASTGPPALVEQASATVTGAVNPGGQPTSYRFEYGTTSGYGSSTGSASAGAGTTDLSVSGSLLFLLPSTTYHYRLLATSPSGTAAGSDRTLTTTVLGTTLDRTPPALRISGRTLRLGRLGAVRPRVRCGGGDPEPCAGLLKLYARRSGRRLGVGSARFRIAPGASRAVRVRLSRTGRALVRRVGRARLLATARARDAAGNVGTARARIVVRVP